MALLDPVGTRSLRPSDSRGNIGAPLGNVAVSAITAPAHLPRPTAPKAPAVPNGTPTAAQTPPPTAAASTVPVFDPNMDPAVQLVQAAGARSVTEARAAELAGRKQALIDYGYDPAFAGQYPDQATAQAAQQNPFSFLANAAHDYGVRTNNLDEALNKANLFYSSYRGNQLGENARGYQQQLAGGASNLGKALSALSAAVLAARDKAAADETTAKATAYQNYTPPETVAPAAAAAPAGPFDVTPGVTYPAGMATSTAALPVYTGQPLDEQLLADLARPATRRTR